MFERFRYIWHIGETYVREAAIKFTRDSSLIASKLIPYTSGAMSYASNAVASFLKSEQGIFYFVIEIMFVCFFVYFAYLVFRLVVFTNIFITSLDWIGRFTGIGGRGYFKIECMFED